MKTQFTPEEATSLIHEFQEDFQYAMDNPTDVDPVNLAIQHFCKASGLTLCPYDERRYCAGKNCPTCETWAKYSGLSRSY